MKSDEKSDSTIDTKIVFFDGFKLKQNSKCKNSLINFYFLKTFLVCL